MIYLLAYLVVINVFKICVFKSEASIAADRYKNRQSAIVLWFWLYILMFGSLFVVYDLPLLIINKLTKNNK